MERKIKYHRSEAYHGNFRNACGNISYYLDDYFNWSRVLETTIFLFYYNFNFSFYHNDRSSALSYSGRNYGRAFSFRSVFGKIVSFFSGSCFCRRYNVSPKSFPFKIRCWLSTIFFGDFWNNLFSVPN